MTSLVRMLLAATVAESLLPRSPTASLVSVSRFGISLLYATTVVVLTGVWRPVWSPIAFISVLTLQHLVVRWIYDKKLHAWGSWGWIVAQASHIATVILVGSVAYPEGIEIVFAKTRIALENQAFWIAAFGYALILWPAGKLVEIATRRWTPQMRTASRGLPEAGRWIGYLERALIVSFILVGKPAAIAVLVAAKGVLRFGEVRDPANRELAEYILIGSMLSYGVAMAVGYMLRTWCTTQ